jgi:hypothetical protein
MALTLAQVDAAIEDVQQNGQSFTQDGTTYTRANLQYLIDLRDDLLRETARTTGRPLFRAVGFSSAGYDGT